MHVSIISLKNELKCKIILVHIYSCPKIHLMNKNVVISKMSLTTYIFRRSKDIGNCVKKLERISCWFLKFQIRISSTNNGGKIIGDH